MSKLIESDKNLMLIGPTGTGKSSIISDNIHKMSKKGYQINNLNFSAQATAKQTQELIIEKMTRIKKDIYVPSALNKKTIIFIDDLNMPTPEKYGAQPPIELLRNLVDHSFLYDSYIIDNF